MKLLSNPDVYEPQEDSFLMETLVKRFASGAVLEIGTGSGILSIAAASSENVDSVLACDINEKALSLAKKNARLNNVKIKFVYSDLFSKIKKKFDFIIFNPPYLPIDRRCPDDLLEKALSGGRRGHETLERFFLSLGEHLNSGGKALVVFSSLTGKEKVDSVISDCLFEKEMVASEKLGFEELYAYLVSKSPLLKKLESRKIHSIKKLAKGWRGLVYSGILGRKAIAIKINNPSSTAVGRIENEEIMLALANKKGIGPKLMISESDFFADELVGGERILVYLSHCSKKEALSVLSKTLSQCFILDKAGINKEEMHHPIKHVIVSKNKPVMIDFERAHFAASPSNLTQFCQFICSEPVFSLLVKKGINFERQVILGLCREYKKDYSPDSLKRILRLIIQDKA